MKYSDAVKEGFRIINKNWQLIPIHMGTMFVSFLGFFIVVGIPLAIAFVIFGIDLTGLSQVEDIFSAFRRPTEILSRYFALAVLVFASILLYITVVFSLGIFLFGGTMGVIRKFIEGTEEKFHLRTFYYEGKRLFFPLLGFSVVVGLLFTAVAFVLGLFGGATAAIYSLAQEKEVILALFLGLFFSMVLIVTGLILIMATMAVTTYGMAVLVFKGFGPLRALKEGIHYMYTQNQAFYLYSIVFLGYLVLSSLVVFLGLSVSLIPIIGSSVAGLYKFLISAAQIYFGLALIAIVFYYYYSTVTAPTPIDSGSTQEPETSVPQAPEQDPPPPGTDPQGQA